MVVVELAGPRPHDQLGMARGSWEAMPEKVGTAGRGRAIWGGLSFAIPVLLPSTEWRHEPL